VRVDEQEALRLGVTSVPTFLIDRRLVVAGARPAAELLGVLRRAWLTS
jgi:predicted DsbA family dithiol-disulfide isomerase